MKSKNWYRPKKTLTKKYTKDIYHRLEYIRDEVFEGGTIVYPNNYILSLLLDINYEDTLIEKALKKLEDERLIMRACKGTPDYKDFPFEWWVDIIPF